MFTHGGAGGVVERPRPCPPSGPDPSDHGSVETRSPPTLRRRKKKKKNLAAFNALRLPSYPHHTALTHSHTHSYTYMRLHGTGKGSKKDEGEVEWNEEMNETSDSII